MKRMRLMKSIVHSYRRFIRFIRFIRLLIAQMVVRTRSYYTTLATVAGTPRDSTRNSNSSTCVFHTPSLREASVRSYKVYTPKKKATVRIAEHHEEYDDHEDDSISQNISAGGCGRCITMSDAANIIVSFQNVPEEALEETPVDEAPVNVMDPPTVEPDYGHQCINPMTPIQNYIYRMDVYSLDQTIHYKSAYVIYDKTTRMYTIHAIVSNIYAEDVSSVREEDTPTANLPLPKNTIQMKYATHVRQDALNYIMTVVLPSVEYDYYIKDDVIGIVGNNDIYNADTSFYDLEQLLYDNTSSETTNGYKAFLLIPSRNFWYTPAPTIDTDTITATAFTQNKYTVSAADSILNIL